MLPLTEGSLRLRADDEDSLTSEDSFFSATEVNRLGDQAGLGQASGPELGCVRNKVIFLCRNEALLSKYFEVPRSGRPEKPGVKAWSSREICPHP